MDLSIVIVNWNTKDFLLRCLETLEQDARPLETEIIVVDNGSSDDSVAAVRERFPRVCVIENPANQGFARANNIGIEQAKGTYVCLINSDVELTTECLPRMFRYMERHTDIGILAPRIVNPDLTLQETCKKAPTLWRTLCRALWLDSLFPKSEFFASEDMRFWNHNTIRNIDTLAGCFWMVRGKAFAQVGGLDETFFFYSEDKDWCLRFWKAGWRVVYFPEVQAIHYGGASSSRESVRFSIEMCRANLQYWKKHHGPLGQIAVGALLLLQQVLRLIAGVLLYLLRPSKRQTAHHHIVKSLTCSRFLIGLRRA